VVVVDEVVVEDVVDDEVLVLPPELLVVSVPPAPPLLVELPEAQPHVTRPRMDVKIGPPRKDLRMRSFSQMEGRAVQAIARGAR
jgi:hypothetical protein